MEVSPRVPRTLADGSRLLNLPPSLERFRGRPVIGVREVSRRATELPPCTPSSPSWRVLKLNGAWLSPDGLSVGLTVAGFGHGHRYQMHACDFVWVDERRRQGGVGLAPSRDPIAVSRAGGGLNLTSQRGTPRAFLWIPVLPAADWALVDRGSYWVAYAARGRSLLRVSGAERIMRSSFLVRVAFVAENGREIGWGEFRGYVAG